MQSFYRATIIKRMLGEKKYKEFDQEYNKFKAYNVYKEVFEDQFKVSAILSKLRRDWDF